jgi:hypothetical protein
MYLTTTTPLPSDSEITTSDFKMQKCITIIAPAKPCSTHRFCAGSAIWSTQLIFLSLGSARRFKFATDRVLIDEPLRSSLIQDSTDVIHDKYISMTILEKN